MLEGIQSIRGASLKRDDLANKIYQRKAQYSAVPPTRSETFYQFYAVPNLCPRQAVGCSLFLPEAESLTGLELNFAHQLGPSLTSPAN